MLKRLRIRFVAVIMVIVTAMLCLIFGMIYSFTKSGMETESISMMQAVAAPMGQSLVFADMSSELATLSSLAKTCVLIGVLCFAVFLGISILLALWMVRPVESAWEQQRRFVTDASHELKTPLTVIMSNAELLQLPEYDAENKARFADRILTMSRHMRGLVERLLELARADDGRQRTVRARLNLGELVEYSLLPFEPLFFEKGLEIAADIQPNISVDGDGEQLRQVVDILLDNAQKYALAPDKVEISLRKNRHHCLLSVSNVCEPMDKEETRNLFKRFYRTDKARSRDGSFGLGLPAAE